MNIKVAKDTEKQIYKWKFWNLVKQELATDLLMKHYLND